MSAEESASTDRRPWLRSILATTILAAFYLAILALPLFSGGAPEAAWRDPALLLFFAFALFHFLTDVPAALSGATCDVGGPRFDGALARVISRLAAGALLVVFWLSIHHRAQANFDALGDSSLLGMSTIQLCGACGMLVGSLIRLAAVFRLGSYFVEGIGVRLGQSLIDDGVYSVVRHPAEVGNLFVVSGGALLLDSRTALVVAVAAFLPLVLLRIKIEDRYLERCFTRRHRRYARRVQALVPYLY